MAEKPRRGFAALDPEKLRRIARLGSQMSHARGKAHEFTTEEARHAGTKGGRVISRDRKHMSRIGIKGGKAAARRKRVEEEEGKK